jgi:hypothetical protein
LIIIESWAFSDCALKTITIPRHVEILGSSCFAHCASLSSISFEADSELTRIEAGAFAATSVSSVVIPKSILFAAGDAFPTTCVVALAGTDSDAELTEWTRRRQSGSIDPFERRGPGTGESPGRE